MTGPKHFARMLSPLLVLPIILAATAIRAGAAVSIRTEPLRIPTYQVGRPDPNPRFFTGRAYQGAQGRVYPYPMLDTLTDNRVEKTYNAVYLENDYVKLCVLPEIGGRVFSALDKTNNYDFLYRQHVVKPALIGMLGAWISGGIEWCIPHHHRATTFMPVDYKLTENPDGSKTLWIGEIELRHRTKWAIGLTLYPGKSYMEAAIKIINRTPFVNSILCWANVAVHANENYQVIFPPSTEYATYHGKNQFARWPVSHEFYSGADYSKGVDLSWWKNHPSPMSFFAWNYRDDFFAGYDHGANAGTAYVANHHIAPGKKLWQWGPGLRGQMWDKILTETDGPYVEIMAGAYSDNQPDYSWLQPYEVKIIKQYWYPIRKIPGVKNANLNGAVDLDLTNPTLAKIAFNTTSMRKNARVLLTTADSVLFERRIDISPERPFSAQVAIPEKAAQNDLRLSLLSSENEQLVSYSPVEKQGAPMPEPVKPPPAPKHINSVEELYLAGLRLDQFHHATLSPYPYYEEALARDPNNFQVNTELGILYSRRGMFKEARQKLNRAIDRVTKNYTSPKDGRAHYYLGIALKLERRYDAAYDALYKATWTHACNAAAYYNLAEIDCIRGDFHKALEHLDRSIATNAWNTKALNLKAAVLRRLGKLKQAASLAAKTLAFDPLGSWAQNELYLAKFAPGAKRKARALKASHFKTAERVQSSLELALDYGNCGLFNEALESLARLAKPAEGRPADHPMVYYYLGFFSEKKGDAPKAKRYYRAAAKMPPDYCFPFRLESIAVLNRAIALNPSDARAHYYLGNLLYDNQPRAAIEQWEKSALLDPTFPTVHRNLAFACAYTKNDTPAAIAAMEKAVACDSRDPRLYYELDLLYEAGGISPQKRLDLLQQNHETLTARDDALAREIALHVQTGQYDRAIELLKDRHFHTWEGGGRIHRVYADAHLLRGLKNFKNEKYRQALQDYAAAMQYPENLEVGRPKTNTRLCQIHFLIGRAHEALGDTQKARDSFEKAASAQVRRSEYAYYKGLALAKLGSKAEALQVFERMAASATPQPEVEFFAKFGQKQAHNVKLAQTHYLLGLAHLGKGEKQKARAEFEKTLELNINHLWAPVRLSELN